MAAPLLAIDGVSKRFGGVQALNGLSFEVYPGEIVSLIGPNGAGKTTLFNVATGFSRADAGRVTFDGRDVTRDSPEAICRAGLVRTFQASRVFPRMTVIRNVMVGALSWASGLKEAERAARQVFDHFGSRLHEYAERRVGTLSFANRRRAEIARALACRPKLLALDEPTAGMNPTETREIMDLIRKLRDGGLTILVIEHDMTLVMGVSDRIVVVDHGELLTTGRPDEVRTNTRVIEAYLGRERDGS
jgi:ABC-type branched-subunit amino acid transport system ATPase component